MFASDSCEKVSKGKQRIDFFTIPEYEQWLQDTPGAHKWDSKYYKVSNLFSGSHLSYTQFRVLEQAMIPMPVTTSVTWLSI